MNIALIAAASLAVAATGVFATGARADENPMARTQPPLACAMDPLAHRTAYESVDELPAQAFCPQFLSTPTFHLPRHDLHT
jgi:hypothetical protein